MADRGMRYLRRLNQQGRRRRVLAIGHRQQLFLDSGRIFMLLGTLILMHQTTTSAVVPSHAEYLFIAFLVWLLATVLVMLSLVAQQFPRLAAAAVAVARALRNYLLGGL